MSPGIRGYSMPKIPFGFFVFISCLALCSCSRQTASIVGKWHEQDDPPENVTEFRNDGTFTAVEVTHAGTTGHAPLFTNLVSGSYQFLASDRIELRIKNESPVVMTNTFRIMRDQLEMTVAEPQHQATVFHFKRTK